MSSRRVHAVFLNPYCNAGQGLARWQQVLASPEGDELGLQHAEVFTGDPAEAPAWAEAQLKAGRRNFLAAGGDGTVNLAVTALLRASHQIPGATPTLGAIGLGSSNDFHKPMDVGPGRTRVAGFPARVDFSSAFLHDVGHVRLDHQLEKIFVINASVGVTAEANHLFNSGGPVFRFLKRASVDAAILAAALSTFVRYRGIRASVRAANQELVPPGKPLANLGITKSPHFSGSFRFPTDPGRDSGTFGVHALLGGGKLGLLRALLELAGGRFSGTSLTAEEVTVQAAIPFAVETDGEVTSTQTAHFRVGHREVLLCS